jgi:hypothetical protein
MGRNRVHIPAVAALAVVLLATPLSAQTETARTLALELNRVDQIGAACRFTFLADNRLGSDMSAFTVETVIIDAEGVVDRLTLFEFGALPDDTPRVRQFDVPDLTCDGVGRILINGVSDCGGVGDCAAGLTLTNRTDVELLG